MPHYGCTATVIVHAMHPSVVVALPGKTTESDRHPNPNPSPFAWNGNRQVYFWWQSDTVVFPLYPYKL